MIQNYNLRPFMPVSYPNDEESEKQTNTLRKS